ncbi:putative DNA binding domain-containing protein [Myxococcota bacterium]|nr:putative DNA binding domain-containing protein [Myxococcota bacterium]
MSAMDLPLLDDIPATLDPAAWWALVGREEHERLDFKRQPGKSLPELLPAMAMTDGGLVVFGIDDDRNVVGAPLDQPLRDTVADAVHVTGVEVRLREVRIGGVPVVVVAVPKLTDRVVTTPDGRLLRRQGSRNRPLVGDAMVRFVLARGRRSAEDEAVVQVEPAMFDLDLVNAALRSDGRPGVAGDQLLRALIDLKVADPQPEPLGMRVTLAAVLAFGRRPDQVVPGARVQLVRRAGVGPGPTPTRHRSELTGPVPKLVDAVIDWVRSNTTAHEAVIGRKRQRIDEYPVAVVREAVANALAHRDYALVGATVDVTVWDDRIEIRSPGGLPGHITLLNIREEHYSRNPRVMGVLKYLRVVEEYGEGVDRMIDEMEARLMAPPTFLPTDDSVTVVLHNRTPLSVEDQAWLAMLADLDLSPAETRLVVEARRLGPVARRELEATLSGVDVPALLRAAVARGLVVQRGQRGGVRYALSDEIVLRAGARGINARDRRRQTLLDELRRRGQMTTPEAAEFLGESDRPAVRALLDELVRAGDIDAMGERRWRRWIARSE